MNKHTTRILSLLLALFTSISVFASCGGTETETEAASASVSETETVIETETEEVHPTIEKKDYGEVFHFMIHSASNQRKYHWVEETQNDAMSESLWARQEKIREHIGVQITAEDAGDHTVYTEPFKTSVKNKDGAYQLVVSHVHSGIVALIQGNYLRDFTEIDEIDLNADYWNREFMDGLSLDGHMYLGRSDFNILYTYVITFNKEMMAQYEDAMQTDVYTLVQDYKWTLDQMMGLASQVYIDTTADGKTHDDTFGIAGVQWVPYIGFLHASGLQYIGINDAGEYEVVVYNELNQERTAILIDKLTELAAADYSWFRYRVEPTPIIEIFTGRTLMQITNTYDLPVYSNYELEFGILPYPMFDEAQADIGYRSLQWGGYLCMPSYSANPVADAETMELLAFYSDPVNITFYEKLLGRQVAEAPLDKKMLDLIWDSLVPEFGQAYAESTGNWLYMIPELTHSSSTHNLASYVQSKKATSNKSISKFLTLVKKMNERH